MARVHMLGYEGEPANKARGRMLEFKFIRIALQRWEDELTDWKSAEPPTERRFRDFMHQVAYLPVHQSEGATWRELVFPSGVTARFRDEMLESIRLIERENKSSPIALMSDEREPTPEQISDMFSEATLAVQAGAKRAALLIAWAGLEHGDQAGRQQKTKLDPAKPPESAQRDTEGLAWLGMALH